MMRATRTSPRKNPPATPAPATAAGDASDDDSSDPPYKQWDKASSESELDDEDNDSGKQRGSTISTKLMEKSKTDLVNIVLQQKKQIIDLQEKLDKSKIILNQSKKQVKIFQNWTGEETNYANSVTQFCKTFLFPRYKFLKDGWHEYNQNKSSLSSLVKRHFTMPKRSNYETLWERGVIPTI
jgi:hypothetical protein